MYKREKFNPVEVEQKIELINPIKVFPSANGWDLKVTRAKALEILGGERKFPFFELGNKNFPRERTGYNDRPQNDRPRGGNRDNHYDNKNRNGRDDRDSRNDYKSDYRS